MRKATCATLVGAAFVLGTGVARAQDLFDLQKVADGVYAALAKPRTPINCNAAVIVYDEGVLVVDTHSRPSSDFKSPVSRSPVSSSTSPGHSFGRRPRLKSVSLCPRASA